MPRVVVAPAGTFSPSRVAAKSSGTASGNAASTSASASAAAAPPDAFVYVATAAGSLLTVRCPHGVTRTTVGELKRRLCEIRPEWVPRRQTLFADRPIAGAPLASTASAGAAILTTQSQITATTPIVTPTSIETAPAAADATAAPTPDGPPLAVEAPTALQSASSGALTLSSLPAVADAPPPPPPPLPPTHVEVALAEDDRVLAAYGVANEDFLRLVVAALEWSPPQLAWIQVLVVS